MVSKLQEIAKAMGMQLNQTKTVYAVAGVNEQRQGPLQMQGGKSAEQMVEHGAFKYLGVHIATDGSWTKQEEVLTEKIEGYLSRLSLKSLRETQAKTVVQSVILPTILYAGAIAALSDSWVTKTETRILRAVKGALKLRSGTSTAYIRDNKIGPGIPSLRDALDNEIISSSYLRLNQVNEKKEGCTAWQRLSDTLGELDCDQRAMQTLSCMERQETSGRLERQVWTSRTKSRAEVFLKALGRQGWSATPSRRPHA